MAATMGQPAGGHHLPSSPWAFVVPRLPAGTLASPPLHPGQPLQIRLPVPGVGGLRPFPSAKIPCLQCQCQAAGCAILRPGPPQQLQCPATPLSGTATRPV